MAAAWLRDIGYATGVRHSGFRPLDGACCLRALGWPGRCDLVAHHSGSRYVAAVRGLGAELAEFTYTENPVADALTLPDQSIGAAGQAMTLEQRMSDMLTRHGPDSPNARARAERGALHPCRRSTRRRPAHHSLKVNPRRAWQDCISPPRPASPSCPPAPVARRSSRRAGDTAQAAMIPTHPSRGDRHAGKGPAPHRLEVPAPSPSRNGAGGATIGFAGAEAVSAG